MADFLICTSLSRFALFTLLGTLVGIFLALLANQWPFWFQNGGHWTDTRTKWLMGKEVEMSEWWEGESGNEWIIFICQVTFERIYPVASCSSPLMILLFISKCSPPFGSGNRPSVAGASDAADAADAADVGEVERKSERTPGELEDARPLQATAGRIFSSGRTTDVEAKGWEEDGWKKTRLEGIGVAIWKGRSAESILEDALEMKSGNV